MSKATDKRLHWIRDWVRQGHFRVVFIRGLHNVADFFTKPLPVARHRVLAPFIAADPADDDPNNTIALSNLTMSSTSTVFYLLLRTDSTLHHAGVFILHTYVVLKYTVLVHVNS
jgi:hypothetical protein